MKKIIPFTSDIKFNTKIYEITSISLEHNLKIEENNIVSGEFIISGDYKMNDASINTEPFIQGIPFDITLDTKYDMDRIKIDIDDFRFEIINEEILKVNIDVLIEGVELVELNNDEEEKEDIKPDLIIEPRKLDITDEYIEDKMEDNMDNISIEDLFKQTDSEVKEVTSYTDEKVNNTTMDSIFNNFSSEDEKYVTYYVHIVRENDNIESISSKYGVSVEELKEYNNIEQITLGSKIIVPYTQSEIL